MSFDVNTDASSPDPNVRDKIISSVAQLFSLKLTEYQINTKIGQPSFIGQDLPMIHIMMGDEQVDQYLGGNLFKDIRESPLIITVITDRFTVGDEIQYFNKDNFQAASTYIEHESQRISDLIIEHEKEGMPDEVVWSILSDRTFKTEASSDPRIVSGIITFSIRYTLDLNHPYFNLGYTLPEIPPAIFD